MNVYTVIPVWYTCYMNVSSYHSLTSEILHAVKMLQSELLRFVLPMLTGCWNYFYL